ncbi:MAG: lysophospholipid acyltransferase family protein [Flavitalea sp.]
MALIERLKKAKVLRKILYAIIGVFSYPGLAMANKLQISGTEHLKGLPRRNVLIVSNHQTYFADVITFLHIFSAVKWGRKNKLGFPFYLLNTYTNIYYVAAEETMKKNWISKLFTLGGALTVKRTWNQKSNEKRRGLDPSDTRKISRALMENWVIQFPQGTTTPFAPGRKGTAHLIKMNRPIVIPVVIDGFSTAFDKKGLKIKRRGTILKVQFKEKLPIDYDAPVEQILDQVMMAIGQKKI